MADKRLESGSRGMRNHPLVDQERGKRPQEAPQNRVRSQEVKGKNDALNLFPKAYFSGGRQGFASPCKHALD